MSRLRVRGAGGAAEHLGLRPTTLETRMAKLGLTPPRSRVGRVTDVHSTAPAVASPRRTHG
jgi:hypothetical protein